MERRLDEASLRLRALGHALAGLDPDKPLRLGYARIERKDGTVSSAAEIAPGDELTLCFADGARRASRNDVRSDEARKPPEGGKVVSKY